MYSQHNTKWYDDYESAALLLSGEPDDSNKKIISELNAILQPMGCSIELRDFDNDPDDKRYYLYLRVSPRAAADYSRRGAGRKPKMAKDLITVKKVREMMEQSSADSVAAELGISRSTLFRRLKNLDDEDFF